MADQRARGPVRISRAVVASLALGLLASAIFVGVVTAPRSAPQPIAPTVFYEVLDAHDLTLFAQPLDGRTGPRAVASRPSTGEGQARWEVDPSGSIALAFAPAGAGSVVEAVEIAGGQTLWRQELDGAPSPGVWSRDGQWWASTTTDADGVPDRVTIINLRDATNRSIPVERGWWPQGFTSGGDLLLTEELPARDRVTMPWRFRLVVAATGAVVPVEPGAAASNARSQGTSDVSTSGGLGLRGLRVEDPAIEGGSVRLELVELETNERRVIGPDKDPNYNWIALTPDASRILAQTYVEDRDGQSQNALLVMNRRGEGAEVWRGPLASDRTVSSEGRYLGLTSWASRPLLIVVHLGTGNSLEIPLAPRIVAATIRAIVDPVDDPGIAVASLQPPESPAPTPAAAPLAGAPRFLAASSEVTAESWVGRVSILAPGEAGGVAVVATMPPLELPILDGTLTGHPRPNGTEVLVEVSGERPSRFWLWTPGAAPVELDLPELPERATQVRWRPDGRAVAFHYWNAIGDDVESGVAILDFESREVRVIPVEGPYGDLAGWGRDGRHLLLHHQICVEGCPGRYAFVARLDPDGGVVTPVEVGDRDPAAYLAYQNDAGRQIILTSVQLEEADDVILRWPAELAALSGVIDRSPDLLDLHVSTNTDDVLTLYLVRDVLARGAGVFDAEPVELGRLPIGLTPRSIVVDREWVLAADRAGTTFLVRLSTGESWEIGPFTLGQLSWLPPR